MKTLLTILALVFATAGLCQTTTYTNYVNSEGGSDANDGTTWAKAKATIPSALVRDTTYYIAYGTYQVPVLNTALDGEKYIILRKATTNNHGEILSGGWTDAMGKNPAVLSPVQVNGTGFWIIDGTEGGGPTCNWTNNFGFKITVVDGQCGVLVNANFSATNVAVKHIEFKGIGTAVHAVNEFRYASPLTWDYDTPYAIGSNYIGYCYSYDNGIGVNIVNPFCWRGGTIEYNFFGETGYTVDHHSAGIYTEQNTNLVVRYNIFHDVRGACDYSCSGDGGKYYGNVYFNSGWGSTGNGAFAGWSDGKDLGSHNMLIANNTIVCIPGSNVGAGGAINFPHETDGSLWNICISNNLVYNWSNYYIGYNSLKQSKNPFNSGYNYSYTADSSVVDSSVGSASSALDATVFSNLTKLDFRPTRSLHPGIPMAAEYATDAYGNTRGGPGKTWDVGAFQFTSGAAQTGVRFLPPSISDYESNAIVTITVFRNGSGGAASVDYESYDGTATQPLNYVQTNGTLNWADLETGAKTFQAQIKHIAGDNRVDGSNLQFHVYITNAVNCTISDPSNATITILEDDIPNLEIRRVAIPQFLYGFTNGVWGDGYFSNNAVYFCLSNSGSIVLNGTGSVASPFYLSPTNYAINPSESANVLIMMATNATGFYTNNVIFENGANGTATQVVKGVAGPWTTYTAPVGLPLYLCSTYSSPWQVDGDSFLYQITDGSLMDDDSGICYGAIYLESGIYCFTNRVYASNTTQNTFFFSIDDFPHPDDLESIAYVTALTAPGDYGDSVVNIVGNESEYEGPIPYHAPMYYTIEFTGNHFFVIRGRSPYFKIFDLRCGKVAELPPRPLQLQMKVGGP